MHIYHINVADADKKHISAIFHTENFQIRIIIVIKTFELDIDFFDVKWIIQYESSVKLDMKVLWQKFEHAVHDSDQKDVTIFIIESWMLEERLKKVSAVKIIKQTHSCVHALSDDSDLSQITLSDDNNMIDAFNASDAESEANKK